MSHPTTIAATAERKHVGIVLLVSVVIIVVLVTVFYLPMRRDLQRVTRDVRTTSAELKTFQVRHCQPPLEVQLARAEDRLASLQNEWELLRSRVDTFKGRSPLSQIVSAEEDARIDFKVALFDARMRLQEIALEQGVKLPSDLGMADTIATGEDTETRLWQLSAIARLMQLCIDVGVPRIEEIRPYPLIIHPLLPEEGAVVREYPVRVTVTCGFDALTSLFSRMLEEDSFFAVRRVHFERTTSDHSELLRVTAVCGGNLFALRGADDPVIDMTDVELVAGDRTPGGLHRRGRP